MDSPPPSEILVQDLGRSEPQVDGAKRVPYDPARTRENFRGLIALLLIALMTGIIVATLALFWLHPDRVKDLKDLFALIFGPVVALVGAATGYYFGYHDSDRL